VLAEAFAGPRQGPARLVRVNAAGSADARDDLALAATLELDGLAVPQATVAAVDAVAGAGVPVLAVVESAQGLREAYDLASRPHVRALQLGAKDLALDLRLQPRTDALELLHARSRLVVDAVAAGLDGVFDRVLFGVGEEELEADARFARSLGFTGKSTTTARDAAVINRVFGNGELVRHD
jgi:citrate lyase beta subunit